MHLLEQYMIEERATIMEHNIRVRMIGRREGIPDEVLREIDKTVELSRNNTGMRLCLAINYGGRAELVDAVRRIAQQVAERNTCGSTRSTSKRSPITSTRPACPIPTC